MGLEIDSPAEGEKVEPPFTVSGTCPQDHEVTVNVGGNTFSSVASGTSFSVTVPNNQDTMMIAGEVTIAVTCPVSERTTVSVIIDRGIPR